jgi:UDP-N-acetylmuramate--alanine ligase
MAAPVIRAGIFFGGPSREREISFAGGRTVFDNLDKSLFRPVLFFVDSARQLIELDWHYIYRGTIRDFYPPAEFLPPSPNGFQIYLESLLADTSFDPAAAAARVGKRLAWSDLPGRIDLAFLALHGAFGEDGQLQGMLEALDIPYTGSGILASAIGMDKRFQKKLMKAAGFAGPAQSVIARQAWQNGDPLAFYQDACHRYGDKVVIRPANQGSSIGVSIIPLRDPGVFMEAVDKAFFRQRLAAGDWAALSPSARVERVRQISDIREGLGFPLLLNGERIDHPETLLERLDGGGAPSWILDALDQERDVLLEGFLDGQEFSCIVIRTEEGRVVALPPTEIIKGGEVFDYRSKYLPGLSRKETPIQLPEPAIQAIRGECERLFEYLEFQVYARIDGFILRDGTICLNDPNTTSGMMPSSFFFHQAAEIGLNPSQFLTYIIRMSLQERLWSSNQVPPWADLLPRLDQAMRLARASSGQRRRIAVILGGYSSERHISVESGRNIYEKLSASGKYEPIPVFLTGGPGAHRLFVLPVNLLLKDNADDIRERVLHPQRHPVVEGIRAQCSTLTARYGYASASLQPLEVGYPDLPGLCEGVFIALHGRPGEDGEVQSRLEEMGLPYNGSDVSSSRITIDKYRTLQILREHGFLVANQYLASRADWEADAGAWVQAVESRFDYPFIAKPVDDGCSSAVKILRDRRELSAYAQAIYRGEAEVPEQAREVLRLKYREEFPRKDRILFETLIRKGDAAHFLEITGGLLTHWEHGGIRYEVFEPSEALAGEDVLSLEEKFLAGEGQNITPARFSRDPLEAARISARVREDLERAAHILGVSGYARIDAFVRIMAEGKVETWIIEVNSLPGMTPATCIFHQAALQDYTPYQFIDQIIEYGFHARTQRQPA